MKSATPDNKLAHLRWLQAPFLGAVLYMVERGGRLGYVVADGHETMSSEFFDFADPEAMAKALEAASRTNQPAPASARAAGAAGTG